MTLAALLGALALPVVAGASYQAIGTWRDRRRFPPSGRLVRVNERRSFWSQPKNFISLGQHVAALPISAAQAAAVSSLWDLPLVVLSAEHHAAPNTNWQRDLAQLSSRGRHVVANHSGHWIHLDHPKLVIRAIREVVATACSLQCPSSNL
jgi:pimeloyl-ACP methyl ester carboxylesterase